VGPSAALGGRGTAKADHFPSVERAMTIAYRTRRLVAFAPQLPPRTTRRIRGSSGPTYSDASFQAERVSGAWKVLDVEGQREVIIHLRPR
jgi:hypothetical protein